MKLLNLASLAILIALPCAAETWKNAALVDVACSTKVKADPDSHTRDCAITCEKTGYALVSSDGSILKLDEKGNQQAIAALKASRKADHLHATIVGDRDGDTIKVQSLKM
jgi:hypothetical protein